MKVLIVNYTSCEYRSTKHFTVNVKESQIKEHAINKLNLRNNDYFPLVIIETNDYKVLRKIIESKKDIEIQLLYIGILLENSTMIANNFINDFYKINKYE